MADTRTDPQYKLRLPADLKARIEAAAEANNRSINAEIVSTLLEKYPSLPDAEALLAELKAITERAEEDPSSIDLSKAYIVTSKLIEAMRVRQKAFGERLRPYRERGLLPPDEDDVEEEKTP